MKKRIGNCIVEVGGNFVATDFADGKQLVATVNYTEEDKARAKALGYDSVEEMTLEHDLTHNIVANALGFSESPTLRGVVEGQSSVLADLEERIVMLVQRVSNVRIEGVLKDFEDG